MLVAWPTLLSVWADKIASPLLDRYLARVGYSGQKSKEPLPPGRQDNMFAFVPGDHGAHGRFDDKARTQSVELWMSMHRKEISVGALALAAIGAGIDRKSTRLNSSHYCASSMPSSALKKK